MYVFLVIVWFNTIAVFVDFKELAYNRFVFIYLRMNILYLTHDSTVSPNKHLNSMTILI